MTAPSGILRRARAKWRISRAGARAEVVPAPGPVCSSRLRAAALEAAERQISPFYLFDLDGVGEAFAETHQAWCSYFPVVHVAYAYKANPLEAVTRRLTGSGAWAEVCSGEEQEWALDDGVPASRIVFDGPSKSEAELRRSVEIGSHVSIDSLDQLRLLGQIVGETGSRGRILLRLAQRIGARRSRFGIRPAQWNEALELVRSSGIEVEGCSVHLGSNLPDPSLHLEVLREWNFALVALLAQRPGSVWLDLGGGYPVSGEKGCSSADFASAIAADLSAASIPLDRIELIIEPGRSLVEANGVLVTRVSAVKPGDLRPIVVLDASTKIAHSIARQDFRVEIPGAGPDAVGYEVTGSGLQEFDVFAPVVPGPADLEAGHVVLVGSAGAYDYAGARAWVRSIPAVLGLENGRVTQLRAPVSWRT